jgi:hypothetical protein
MAKCCCKVRFARAAWTEQQDVSAGIDPPVAADESGDMGAAEHGQGGKIKVVQCLAGGQTGLEHVTLDTSLRPLSKLQLGERGQQPRRWPAFAIGPFGKGRPHRGDGRQA